MKIAMFTVPALALAMLVGVGCKSSHEPGVKSSYRSQWTQVAADTAETTAAAKEVFDEAGLKDISGTNTNVDGKVTAKKADDTVITASIEKVGDNLSQVSVTVGTLGDPTLGAEFARKIKLKAED